MRLLFVITQFYKGGAENSLMMLLRQLAHKKYDLSLLILNQRENAKVTSLIESLPSEVKAINFIEKEKTAGRNVDWDENRDILNKLAQEYLSEEGYDWAFHIGEWSSPDFVAKHVKANKKAAWMHTDLLQSITFDAQAFRETYDDFDYYFFASKHSMQSGVLAFPYLAPKSICINNSVDLESVSVLAEEKISAEEEEYFKMDCPVLVSCANIRPEKNHMRQLEAMSLLKNSGKSFIWLNIGAESDEILTKNLKKEIKKRGLEKQFLLLGKKDNPYPFMHKADAVTVLSDYESWSLVITEALALKKPVIATKTSGAAEQIVDGKNGFLTDFSTEAIAKSIDELLFGEESITCDFEQFTKDGCETLEFVMAQEKDLKKILYISDDINYSSGVQKASATQIKALQPYFDISWFSSTMPNEETQEEIYDIKLVSATIPVHGKNQRLIKEDDIVINTAILKVLFGRYTFKQKIMRFKVALGYLFKKPFAPKREMVQRFGSIENFMQQYDAVVVLSEASQWRSTVAKLSGPKKIQWIHTDYALWRNYTSWTKSVTSKDGEIYENYDTVVCISENCKKSFLSAHPHLESKVAVIRNLVDEKMLAKLAEKPLGFDVEFDCFNMITIGRFSSEKNYVTLLEMAHELKNNDFKFIWYFVGDGELKEKLENLICGYGLEENVILTGYRENPYNLLVKMDMMILFSKYEGTPITIDEAIILGVPIIARDVGGISEQIENGKTGVLVNEKAECMAEIERFINNKSRLREFKQNCKNSSSNTNEIVDKLQRLFGG